MPVASQLIRGGAKIVAILEASRPTRWLSKTGSLWGQWERFQEAWEYVTPVIKARTRVKFGQAVVEAWGSDRVEGVVTASLDKDWRPIPGTEANDNGGRGGGGVRVQHQHAAVAPVPV